jgi:hypothetical protein
MSLVLMIVAIYLVRFVLRGPPMLLIILASFTIAGPL